MKIIFEMFAVIVYHVWGLSEVLNKADKVSLINHTGLFSHR